MGVEGEEKENVGTEPTNRRSGKRKRRKETTVEQGEGKEGRRTELKNEK